ncbi:MAG: DegQ family serine endoprotease [Rhizobiaceae bacterium]|jgi:serine protease Do|nr:DegQ family serine endoprotease [Rhizobiaceae bacterium]
MLRFRALLLRATVAGIAVFTVAAVPHPLNPVLVAPAAAQAGPDSVADLAEELLESVVNISTTQKVDAPEGAPRRPRPQLPEGSPFQEFFDEFFGENGPGGGGEGPRGGGRGEVNSLGSGFVVDAEEGIVITNNHVIADADEITVNFNDGRSLDAEIVGRDPKTDIAVLKVDPKKFPLKAVPFGDSDKARIGDWVMAIGNPFGLGGSVTVGIISAQNRNINSGPYDRFIQTDAAINRGNSGGPLFNMDGEVIGINTAIISPSGGSIGIGFSIPSELATGVIAQLREFGETRRGYLGVRIQPVTDDIAESLDMTETKGVLISGVIDGGPVADGTLKAGDIIIEFDGKTVNEPRELSSAVAESPVGKSVDVLILRDGKEQTVKVTLGRLEDGEEQMAANESGEGGGDAAPAEVEVLGMTLSIITDDLRSQYEIAEDLKGVVITKVAEGSLAAGRGLNPGDVVTEVAQDAVNTPEEMTKKIDELKTAGRKNALLMVAAPGGELRFVTIRLD